MNSSYIGCQISLISTSDERYEGKLFSIDPTESTISLENVKHMGTEDRRQEVMEASTEVFQFLTFRGENIKNLQLIDQETETAIINDPAILEVKLGEEVLKRAPVESTEQQWNNQGSGNHRGGWDASRPNFCSAADYIHGGHLTSGRGGYSNGNYNNNYGYPQNNWPQSGMGHSPIGRTRRRDGSSRNEDKNSGNYIPGTGSFLERNYDDSDLVIPEKEYDFQGNLARFDMSNLKDALAEETQKSPEKEPTSEPKPESSNEKIETKEEICAQDLWSENEKSAIIQEIGSTYDKDNFFDNLSTNQSVYNSQTGADMRELNGETFGSIGSTYQCRTRWFRRWRGRGSSSLFRGAYNQRK